MKLAKRTIDTFVVLRGISCVDADGRDIEHYDRVYVAKDVVRKSDGTPQKGFTYGWIEHFENNRSFLPSLALGCNILVALFRNAVEKQPDRTYKTKDEELKAILDQYTDPRDGNGFHSHNTIIDWENSQIVHYPSSHELGIGYNQSKAMVRLPFIRRGFGNAHLASAAVNPEMYEDHSFRDFIRNLTGLRNPSVLVDIGDYFGGKYTRISIPDTIAGKSDTMLGSAKTLPLFAVGTPNVGASMYSARGVRSSRNKVLGSGTNI